MATVVEEARRAGLRKPTLSLADVGRRRVELYALAVIVAAASVLVGTAVSQDVPGLLQNTPTWVIRGGFGALGVAFLAYVAEKESRLRRLEALLIDERIRVAELSRLDRLKTDFLSTVSHELKTPLTAIIGSVSTLRRVILQPAEREELMDTIDRNARRLASMVDQLLVAGRMAAADAPVEVPEGGSCEVEEVVREVACDAEPAGTPFAVEVRESGRVAMDADSLRQVTWNLVENAHKHGAAPVTVAVKCHRGTVTLSVLDAGPGVPPEARDHVFGRFHRLDGATGRPGMGLGLPIVRDLVESAGGQVWVDDAPDGGAAFRVILPALATEPSGAVEHPSGSLAAAAQGSDVATS